MGKMKDTTIPDWEPTMFDPEYRKGRHRVSDWTTSIEGANSVAYRAGSQKDLLLKAFKAAYPAGLTDEEAAIASGISLTSEYSKRCGELRQDRFISGLMGSNGTVSTRLGSSGVHRIVSAFIVKVGE
jgi:hypothetical protein